MATFGDWDDTPSDNNAIDGVNIAEGCPPGNLNNAVRSVMAACKTFDNDKADPALLAKIADTVISTNAKATGRGAILHHGNAANLSGKITVQATGTAPAMSDGDILLEW